MGIGKGAKHNIGATHKDVLQWVRSAAPGDEFRAGKGLYLRRTEGGAFWVYRYVSPLTGKQVRANLWADDPRGLVGFPDATLADATGRAAALRASVADGIDPVRAGEDARQAADLARQSKEVERSRLEAVQRAADVERERRLNVRQLFERWCSVDLQPHMRADGMRAGRKDAGAYTRDQFERRVFPVLGERAAADVTKGDLMAILDATKAEGKLRTANVLLADLKQMLAFAVTREILERDPLANIKRRQVGGTEPQRDRILTPDELAALAAKLPASRLNKRSAAAVWLLLGTMARAGELMGAVWATEGQDVATLQAVADATGAKVGVVDLVAREWYLPDTKNQRDHRIHLSAFAVAQLEGLAVLRERDAEGEPVPWVFPNSAANGPVCIKSFGKQVADRQLSARKRTEGDRMQGRSKATDSLTLPGGKWTAHDLRRTGATIMADLGISGDVIDECLNHVIESRVRRTYIRGRREGEQVRAFDALGARLQEIIRGQPVASNVVALPVAA